MCGTRLSVMRWQRPSETGRQSSSLNGSATSRSVSGPVSSASQTAGSIQPTSGPIALAGPSSTGFQPTTISENQTVEPLIKRERGNSFLEILDTLNKMDDDEEEKERKKRRRNQKVQSVSSTGIEPNPSDETDSQTFIGKESEARPEPGKILLGLIKAQNI